MCKAKSGSAPRGTASSRRCILVQKESGNRPTTTESAPAASGRIIDFGRRVTFPERDGNEVTIDVAKLHAARELEE
jgi:hypothetical protein